MANCLTKEQGHKEQTKRAKASIFEVKVNPVKTGIVQTVIVLSCYLDITLDHVALP